MNAPRRVVLLGATGSIGTQARDVIRRNPGTFEVVGIVGGSNVDLLAEAAAEFPAARVAIVAPAPGAIIPAGWGVGDEAAAEVAACDADVVLVAITGAAALAPTLAAIENGRDIALATKEVMVMAGDLVRQRALASGARFLPVDSEHSAIWQCLRGESPASVRRIVLTASGGPFRDTPRAALRDVTIDQALRHPNWSMGPKVTIDSATMMNKGLEIIEARHLFDVAYEDIGVVIHPSSTVHSYVEFVDGATMAQLGEPDMRVPIALALNDGIRLAHVAAPLALVAAPPLEFRDVDDAAFPAVELARSAGRAGGVVTAVLNAANEIAVAAFLAGDIRFDEIVPLVAATVAESASDGATGAAVTLDLILAADTQARAAASQRVAEARSARQRA